MTEHPDSMACTAQPKRLRISELNPHLLCALCGGYLIDATTIIECLHSFCKTCILRYLETNNYCPICEVLIHKTRPWQNIRLDHSLQNAVYKMVPGLFQNEMKRRREFYEKQCKEEKRGKLSQPEGDLGDRIIFSHDEEFSISIEFSPDGKPVKNIKEQKPKSLKRQKPATVQQDKRYLKCPAALRVAHLKKFIRAKFSLPARMMIDLFYDKEPLSETYSLMDIAYIYNWKRDCVLRLFYSFFEVPPKVRKIETTAVLEKPLLEKKPWKSKKEEKPEQTKESKEKQQMKTNEKSKEIKKGKMSVKSEIIKVESQPTPLSKATFESTCSENNGTLKRRHVDMATVTVTPTTVTSSKAMPSPTTQLCLSTLAVNQESHLDKHLSAQCAHQTSTAAKLSYSPDSLNSEKEEERHTESESESKSLASTILTLSTKAVSANSDTDDTAIDLSKNNLFEKNDSFSKANNANNTKRAKFDDIPLQVKPEKMASRPPKPVETDRETSSSTDKHVSHENSVMDTSCQTDHIQPPMPTGDSACKEHVKVPQNGLLQVSKAEVLPSMKTCSSKASQTLGNVSETSVSVNFADSARKESPIPTTLVDLSTGTVTTSKPEAKRVSSPVQETAHDLTMASFVRSQREEAERKAQLSSHTESVNGSSQALPKPVVTQHFLGLPETPGKVTAVDFSSSVKVTTTSLFVPNSTVSTSLPAPSKLLKVPATSTSVAESMLPKTAHSSILTVVSPSLARISSSSCSSSLPYSSSSSPMPSNILTQSTSITVSSIKSGSVPFMVKSTANTSKTSDHLPLQKSSTYTDVSSAASVATFTSCSLSSPVNATKSLPTPVTTMKSLPSAVTTTSSLSTKSQTSPITVTMSLPCSVSTTKSQSSSVTATKSQPSSDTAAKSQPSSVSQPSTVTTTKSQPSSVTATTSLVSPVTGTKSLTSATTLCSSQVTSSCHLTTSVVSKSSASTPSSGAKSSKQPVFKRSLSGSSDTQRFDTDMFVGTAKVIKKPESAPTKLTIKVENGGLSVSQFSPSGKSKSSEKEPKVNSPSSKTSQPHFLSPEPSIKSSSKCKVNGEGGSCKKSDGTMVAMHQLPKTISQSAKSNSLSKSGTSESSSSYSKSSNSIQTTKISTLMPKSSSITAKSGHYLPKPFSYPSSINTVPSARSFLHNTLPAHLTRPDFSVLNGALVYDRAMMAKSALFCADSSALAVSTAASSSSSSSHHKSSSSRHRDNDNKEKSSKLKTIPPLSIPKSCLIGSTTLKLQRSPGSTDHYMFAPHSSYNPPTTQHHHHHNGGEQRSKSKDSKHNSSRTPSSPSSSSGKDSVFNGERQRVPTIKISDINRNPIIVDSGQNHYRSYSHSSASRPSSSSENGASSGRGNRQGSESSTSPTGSTHSDRSPARDSRRPSDSELLLSQQWHGYTSAAAAAELIFNGFKLQPPSKFPDLHYDTDAMPLDYSQSSSKS